MDNRKFQVLFVTGVFMLFNLNLFAQVPPAKKSIDITSTFKPVLREASKINFNAAPPQTDTTTPKLNYTIPSNSLFFTYQPAELKAVALQVDSFTAWQYSNFIKVGVGNVHLPYVEAGFTFGNNTNTSFNIFAKHYTSKGDLPFQKNSLTSVAASATYRTPKNLEWNGTLGFRSDDYYLYGYRPVTLQFTKEDLRQRFQTIEGKVNLRNVVPSEYGLSYQPSLKVSVFADNHPYKAAEANTILILPLQKTFGETVAFNLTATVDLTNYRIDFGSSTSTSQNNLYMVAPAVILKKPNLFLHAGLIPSWDNSGPFGNPSGFHLLPNIMAEITTNDKRFTIQGGLIGYYNKGTYQRLASINPWLAQLFDTLPRRNERVQEGYAGFKGTMSGRFSYSAKLGLRQHRYMPLFVNDTVDGKTFQVIYEPKLNVLYLHLEAEYSIGEQFSARGVLNFNQFSNLEQEKRAWGVIPVELNASLRWQLMKDLWFRTELWTWAGAPYRVKNGDNRQGQTAFDLNAGAEFRITRNFNLWLQMNNIFNNRYERWNQYEVYGFNILGGVVYSFGE